MSIPVNGVDPDECLLTVSAAVGGRTAQRELRFRVE